ncbi:unnamed protein product, partial [marine sediment metagenome]
FYFNERHLQMEKNSENYKFNYLKILSSNFYDLSS